jgi:hypothetical protein
MRLHLAAKNKKSTPVECDAELSSDRRQSRCTLEFEAKDREMSSDPGDEMTPDPNFFAGRYLIEITSWDWHLHVGMSTDATPHEYRFQGGVNYSRALYIDGRILAPKGDSGKTIRVWVMPMGPEVAFGPGDLEEVGQFHEHRDAARRSDFTATLLLPQDALAASVTCLASVWKYVDITTVDDPLDRASVTDFWFSRDIHKNLIPWIEGH